MAANKIPGIRAAVCWNEITARNASKLNTNVLTMGGRMIESDAAKKIIKIWLEPTEIEERHTRRIDKIKKIEKGI
ncbi:MAG: ribose-5-phosphate isomerase B [Candidatus Methanolliviera sp. GoM_asphalt]|nr:MAG: ribose-5-phosphate isomerase B [Candidatus Methanolliviera sp. GoM_asphalt]